MPASSLSIGAPSLGDDRATIDSADAFDISLLCNGGVSPAVPCGAIRPSPEMAPKIGTADEQGGTDAYSSVSTTSEGQRSSSVAQHVELKMRNAELQSSYDLLQHAHRLKEEECYSLREEVTAITEERDVAFARVQELRRVLRQFKKNATEFSLQRARMRVEVERLQEESDRIKRNYQKTVTERDRLQENVDAFVSSLDHLKTTTEQLTKERDELKEKLESKECSQRSSSLSKDIVQQVNPLSWIEQSFRLPANLKLPEVDEKPPEIPLDSSFSGETALTSCSQLSCDQDDEARSDRRNCLPQKQGWLSFRWDKGKDDSKYNSGEKDTVGPTEINSSDIPENQRNAMQPGKETTSNQTMVDDVKKHSSNEDINGGEKEFSKEELTKKDLPKAESFCTSMLSKHKCVASSEHSHRSWGPNESDSSFSAHKRNYPRSNSAKENRSVSVRSLFGKESHHSKDGADDSCIILREGAFESTAMACSSLEARCSERRFIWPFHHSKDNDGEIGEAGDADGGDCNAIIRRNPLSSKQEGGCHVSGDDSGQMWPTFLLGRHGTEQSRRIGNAILRRRSNGDISLGSTVTQKM